MQKQFAFLDDLVASLDQMNPDGIVANLADNCIFQSGNADPVVGRDAIRKLFQDFFANPLIGSIKHQTKGSFESDNKAAYYGHVTYTRNDGAIITVPFCDIFIIENAKVASYQIFIDLAPVFTVVQALG